MRHRKHTMKILALQGKRKQTIVLIQEIKRKKQSKHIPKWFIDLMHKVGI
ncbi:hypothetical protein ISN45_Aa02g005670 [Arabidopsis thaliana x Arabidopsis arenosa]|uniref:Uncharacterized protein n=1 Tax=Arabidopsis thaliana x Arabidopsis arenosa TaxID=1240361 RepID=A0A8T2BGD1_9BRAS|nr:hypothetical protein ISN45_Aa02g005670 [Arabidopsis thaliana x Arabidopsis arenosa]